MIIYPLDIWKLWSSNYCKPIDCWCHSPWAWHDQWPLMMCPMMYLVTTDGWRAGAASSCHGRLAALGRRGGGWAGPASPPPAKPNKAPSLFSKTSQVFTCYSITLHDSSSVWTGSEDDVIIPVTLPCEVIQFRAFKNIWVSSKEEELAISQFQWNPHKMPKHRELRVEVEWADH